MNSALRITAVALATALGVMACGGGGGDQFAGIDRLGVSNGAITGFGSIFVNGVEWETTDANISLDDNPGTESDLRLGQVVTVRGKLSADGTRGDADSIDFDNEVEGPVASIDAGGFVVLGQVIVVGPDTLFDDSIVGGFAGLEVGDVVDVSGQRDAGGAIRATRVELRDPGEDDEVRGVVSGLTGSTFQLGGLSVDYGGATLEDFGSDTLSNGDIVEVKGGFAGGVLVAYVVERESDVVGEDGEGGEVEGYIKGLARPAANVANFTINGVPVTTNAGTGYEGGGYADLVNDLKVEVEGEFDASGVLVADKVDIRVQAEDTDVEVAGLVSGLATDGLAIEGVWVRAAAATTYEDSSAGGLDAFSLPDINVGDYVEVRGAEDRSTPAPNDMIATRIERDDVRNEAILRGPVQFESQPDLVIMGVTIGTDSAVFRDPDEFEITEATFFSVVQPGDVVKAQTTLDGFAGDELIADEVEIEELD